MSRKYYRAFFTLLPDDKGFGNGSKEPSGRCVVETSGYAASVKFYAQDLKAGLKCRAAIIVCRDGSSRGVYLGEIVPDEKGRAEARFSLDADDVKDSGEAVENFNMAALILTDGGERVVTAPLSGAQNLDRPSWKAGFTEIVKKAPEPEPTPEPEPVIEEEQPAEEIVPPAEPEQTPCGEAVEPLLEFAEKPSDEKPEAPRYSYSETDNSGGEISLSPIEYLFINNTRVYPFANQSDDTVWIRATPANLTAAFGEYAAHPFVTGAYEKYGHLIIGNTRGENGENTHVLGVPSIFEENAPGCHEMGFVKFESCSGVLSDGENGYWLSSL